MSSDSGGLEDQRRRAATNQSLFREINERIEDLASSTFTEFICECHNSECDERIPLTLEEYEAIRAESAWFFVLPGHEVPAIEAIVESNVRYTVVKKLGVGEAVAGRFDPRGRGESVAD